MTPAHLSRSDKPPVRPDRKEAVGNPTPGGMPCPGARQLATLKAMQDVVNFFEQKRAARHNGPLNPKYGTRIVPLLTFMINE